MAGVTFRAGGEDDDDVIERFNWRRRGRRRWRGFRGNILALESERKIKEEKRKRGKEEKRKRRKEEKKKRRKEEKKKRRKEEKKKK